MKCAIVEALSFHGMEGMTLSPSRCRVRWSNDGLAPSAEVRRRNVPVNRPPLKSFRCEVVSETVTIALRRRVVFGGRGELYVRCSEAECQYVDANEPPCPLTLDLFAEEIREREAQRLQGR
jgi:hypothetical protein